MIKRIAIVCNYKLLEDRVGGMDYFFWCFQKACNEKQIEIDWFFPNLASHGEYHKFNIIPPLTNESLEKSVLSHLIIKKVQYSNVGAYGPFQLMKSVARTYGLTVNKRVDERKDFEKSAIGASKLLKYSCIPNAKKILDRNNLDYNEDDLWFKLFVLHIYHAGAGNVGGLIDNMKPDYGGMWLITDMWQTEFGGFKNASQNYSQVALASNIILEEIIYRKCEYILPCTPEISQISNSNE